MKKYFALALTVIQVFLIGGVAHANCYLPIKYGKPDISKAVMVEAGSQPEKLKAFLEYLNQSQTGTSLLAKTSAQTFESAGYKASPMNSITIYAPSAMTGNFHVFAIYRTYSKTMGYDSNGNITLETVIEGQCGLVKLEGSGLPTELQVEGLSIDSKITTSVPGASSSAGG